MSKKKSLQIDEKSRTLNMKQILKIQEDLLNLNPSDDIDNIIEKYPIKLKPQNNRLSIKTDISSNAKKNLRPLTAMSPLSFVSNISQEKKLRTNLEGEMEFIKNSIIEKFKTEIRKKTDSEIKVYFPKQVKDYEERIQMLLDKVLQQYNMYEQKKKTSLEQEKDIENQIEILKIEQKKLNDQLHESDISIIKLNKKFNIFKELYPYYDVIMSEFNYDENDPETPSKIAKDIQNRFIQADECVEEIKEKSSKIDDLLNKKYKYQFAQRRELEELSSKLREIAQKSRGMEEYYINTINKLKDDLDSYIPYKSENIKLHNMLISIYNELYPKLNLERDIIMNAGPDLELMESDIVPRTYDMDEVIRYINLMIKNGTEATNGSLLREIIAYSNMMLRNVKNQGTNFDPAIVIKEIIKLIKEDDEQEINLQNKIDVLKAEQENDEKKIKELENQIKKINKAYDKIHNKVSQLLIGKNKDLEEKNKKKINNEKNRTSVKFKDNIKIKENNNNFKRLDKHLYTDIKEEDIEEAVKINESINKKFEYYKKNKKYKPSIPPVIYANDYENGTKNLVDFANRLFFYKVKSKTEPLNNKVNVHTFERIDKKFDKLKKIQKSGYKYVPLVNQVENKLNDNLGKVIYNIQKEDEDKDNIYG